MANPYFQFKQFTVQQDLCAMKVGTDGVLLGAWTDCTGCKRILDAGTGSGLIALMLAQRSEAVIDAVDIDEDAFRQAHINVRNSPFTEKVQVFRSDLLTYHPRYRYDLIVSNPPFFSQSLKSPHAGRTVARHNDCLPFEKLIEKSRHLLNESGRMAVVIPFDGFGFFNETAFSAGFELYRKTNVHPTPGSIPKRVLLEYGLLKHAQTEENKLIIEYDRHVYSEEYIALTQAFYLHM